MEAAELRRTAGAEVRASWPRAMRRRDAGGRGAGRIGDAQLAEPRRSPLSSSRCSTIRCGRIRRRGHSGDPGGAKALPRVWPLVAQPRRRRRARSPVPPRRKSDDRRARRCTQRSCRAEAGFALGVLARNKDAPSPCARRASRRRLQRPDARLGAVYAFSACPRAIPSRSILCCATPILDRSLVRARLGQQGLPAGARWPPRSTDEDWRVPSRLREASPPPPAPCPRSLPPFPKRSAI